MLRSRSLVAALGCLALPGCDSEPAAPATNGASAFVLQTMIESPEGRTTYLQALASLDLESVGNERALEVSGNGRFYVDDGRVWYGSGSSSRLVEAQVTPAGLVPGRELDLSRWGVPSAPFGHAFVRRDLAFLFTTEVILWDLSAMEVRGTASIADARRGAQLPFMNPGVRRGDRVFAPVTYAEYPSVDDAVYVAVLDADSGALVTMLRDERCQSAASVHLLEDGSVVVASDAGYALMQFGSSGIAPTCLLRIGPDAERFDPEYRFVFRDATRGRDASGFVYAGDGIGFAFVFDHTLPPAGATLRDFYQGRYSRWWRFDLNGSIGAPVEDMPLIVSGSGIASRIGAGRVALAAPTTFPALDNQWWEVTADGTATARFTFLGRGVLEPLN